MLNSGKSCARLPRRFRRSLLQCVSKLLAAQNVLEGCVLPAAALHSRLSTTSSLAMHPETQYLAACKKRALRGPLLFGMNQLHNADGWRRAALLGGSSAFKTAKSSSVLILKDAWPWPC